MSGRPSPLKSRATISHHVRNRDHGEHELLRLERSVTQAEPHAHVTAIDSRRRDRAVERDVEDPVEVEVRDDDGPSPASLVVHRGGERPVTVAEQDPERVRRIRRPAARRQVQVAVAVEVAGTDVAVDLGAGDRHRESAVAVAEEEAGAHGVEIRQGIQIAVAIDVEQVDGLDTRQGADDQRVGKRLREGAIPVAEQHANRGIRAGTHAFLSGDDQVHPAVAVQVPGGHLEEFRRRQGRQHSRDTRLERAVAVPQVQVDPVVPHGREVDAAVVVEVRREEVYATLADIGPRGAGREGPVSVAQPDEHAGLPCRDRIAYREIGRAIAVEVGGHDRPRLRPEILQRRRQEAERLDLRRRGGRRQQR